MRELPDRPDLDHLRRQARALQRAAAAGDPGARRRLEAVAARPTLTGAQLALARERGFPGWARLRAEVERRRSVVIRPVDSLEELIAAFAVVMAQIEPAAGGDDRRLRDLARRFPRDRELMLVVESRGRLVGGSWPSRPPCAPSAWSRASAARAWAGA
jgi:hypothetical protein